MSCPPIEDTNTMTIKKINIYGDDKKGSMKEDQIVESCIDDSEEHIFEDELTTADDRELLLEEETLKKSKPEQRSVCISVVTMVAHFICVLFTGYVIYTALPGSSLFSWHPTLMALAFMFMLMEGILIFSPQSSLLLSKPRKTKTTWHWIFMSSAVICALGGYIIIYVSKEQKGKTHLKTWHGLIGFSTLLYVAAQLCAGLNLLYPRLISKFIKLATLKLLHATSGLILTSFVVASLMTGMMSNWFQKAVTGTSWYACMACPALLLLIIANQVKNSYLNK